MFRFNIGWAVSLCLVLVFGFFRSGATAPSKPKLVVGIVVDQMRWDYLCRFSDRYSSGGFKRMLQEGFSCEQTYINYLPTFTAPGHASVYTGSVPAIHGIAANDWVELPSGKKMYCTQDDEVDPIGTTNQAGKQSPKNLWASTITDELRMYTNFQSRVYGVAIKDRGAILPAGHAANAAFWFDSETGHFISSSYYLKELPEWLHAFNQRNLADSLLSLDWYTSFPIESYQLSTSDSNAYEGVHSFETAPVFPHKTSSMVGKDRGILKYTPQGNTLTRLLAEQLILAEGLGKRHATDFLAISFSSTDYIGHMYGPNSIEVEDMYYKLDKELELLFSFLDNELGKGNYLVFLTADHGGAHNPVFLNDRGIPAGISSGRELRQALKLEVAKQYDSSVILAVTNYQIFLNDSVVQSKGYNRQELTDFVKRYLRNLPEVAFVMSMDEDLMAVPDIIRSRAIHGYNPKRSGDILIVLKPGWYYSSYNTGTTHGGWHPYDSRIPLLWYGWGIKPGKTQRQVFITDIAPTLAALLNIQSPNGCIGTVIEELFD